MVDDTPDLLLGMKDLLQMEGYQVITASNGEEAVYCLTHTTERVDLIITDLLMPVMDGITLLRTLRAAEKWQRIPVIIFSAKAKSEIDALDTIPTGTQKILSKPCPTEMLLATVSELIATYNS